jgi:hypothetical protein
MIKPKRFRRLPECDTCLFYTGDLMQPCPVHPQGCQQDSCLDYRPEITAELQWQTFLGLGAENQSPEEDPG